jgi:hypothetical protein
VLPSSGTSHRHLSPRSHVSLPSSTTHSTCTLVLRRSKISFYTLLCSKSWTNYDHVGSARPLAIYVALEVPMAITAHRRPRNTPLNPSQPENRTQIRFPCGHFRASGPITVERRRDAPTVVVPTQCRPNVGLGVQKILYTSFCAYHRAQVRSVLPISRFFSFFRTNPPGPARIHISLREFWPRRVALGWDLITVASTKCLGV